MDTTAYSARRTAMASLEGTISSRVQYRSTRNGGRMADFWIKPGPGQDIRRIVAFNAQAAAIERMGLRMGDAVVALGQMRPLFRGAPGAPDELHARSVCRAAADETPRPNERKTRPSHAGSRADAQSETTNPGWNTLDDALWNEVLRNISGHRSHRQSQTPPSTPAPPLATLAAPDAARFLARHCDLSAADILRDRDHAKAAWRQGLKKAHPASLVGDDALLREVVTARDVLLKHHGI